RRLLPGELTQVLVDRTLVLNRRREMADDAFNFVRFHVASSCGHEMASGHCALWRHRRLWTVAYRLRSCERLQQPVIGKRVIARGAIANNDSTVVFWVARGKLSPCHNY